MTNQPELFVQYAALEHVQPCRQPDAALCTGYAPADTGTVSVNGCISAQYNYTEDTDAAEHAYLTCVALNIGSL